MPDTAPVEDLFDSPPPAKPRPTVVTPHQATVKGQPAGLFDLTPGATRGRAGSAGRDIHLSELQEELGEQLLIALYREVDDPYVVAHFIIEGEPDTKSRARWNMKTGRTYTPAQTREAEKRIAVLFRQASGPFTPDGKSSFGVYASFVRKMNQRRDVDNMLKLVMDALTGVVWVDDSQVTEVSAKTRRGHPDPRTDVVIYRTLDQPVPEASCVGCGTRFRVYPSTKGARRFCSRTCSDAARKSGDHAQCAHCGEFWYRKACKRAEGVVHCSMACRRAAEKARPR